MPRIGTGDYPREVAKAAFDSAQFTVPARPALRPEVLVAQVEGGLVFDGGPQPFAVSGPSAVAAFRRLLPRLDGRSTLAQLGPACGLTAANVETLLGLLVVRALVQDGPAGPADPVHVLLSRGAARTGARPDGGAVARALRLFSVAVVADGPLAAATAESLRLGDMLGAVVRCRADQVPETTDLVIAISPSVELIRDLVWRRGIPVIGATLRGASLWCGPWLDRSSGICAACYVAALPSADAPDSRAVQSAASLLSCAVLHTLGRFGRAQSGTRVVRTDLAGSRTTTFDIVCARPGEDDEDVTLIRRYEAAICLPSRDWLDPAINRVHYEQANIRAQTAFQRASGASAGVPVQLRALLRRSVGVRSRTVSGAPPDRCAASAGNLGSVVAYVVLPKSGVHQYDPEADELVRLDCASCDVPEGADAIIMMTADLGKLFPKYGLKAYRLAWLEAGMALGQLHVAAAQLGIPDRALDSWDDAQWEARLGTAARHELICGGVVVGGR